MADIVISGNSSGSVTLRAPDVSGSTILTLPTSSGTLVVTGGAQTVQFAAGTVSAPSITFTGDTNTGIYSPAADTIAFTEGGVESMRIDASGNVGVGTVSPTSISNYKTITINGTTGSLIDMQSNGTTGGRLQCDTTYPGLALFALTNNPMVFGTNSTERMRITSAGDVCIGTTGATKKLTIFANQNGLRLEHAYTTADYSELSFSSQSVAGNGASIRSYRTTENFSGNEGDLRFFTNTGSGGASSDGAERMRIDSSGNLLVGVTSLSSGFTGIQSADYIASRGYVTRTGAGGSYGTNSYNINWTGNNAQLYVDSSLIGNIAFTSDYRVKRNVKTQTESGLERVMSLRPVTYQMADYKDGLFKASDDIKEGFIAHEVQEVIPSGADGIKDDQIQIQSLRVDAILAVAVKAIQEQQAIITQLQADVAELKGAK